jgi:hypothetical protein
VETYIPKIVSGELKPNLQDAILVEPWNYVSGVGSLVSGSKDISTYPLFATGKDLEISDINQQNIGDCAFLASLIGLLATPFGKQFLKKSMCEVADDPEVKGNAVIVRLFDASGSPHYIKLRKSVIEAWMTSLFGEREYHARLDPGIGAWPVFFEMAFTAFDHDGNFVPNGANYGRINGQSPAVVLSLLTGARTQRIAITCPTSNNNLMQGPVHIHFNNLSVLFSGAVTGDLPEFRPILTAVFGPSYQASFAKWLSWEKDHPYKKQFGMTLWDIIHGRIQQRENEQVSVAVEKFGVMPTSKMINAGRVFRIDHFIAIFQRCSGGLPYAVEKQVIDYACKVFPGKRGSGRYNLAQEQLFDLMEARWKNGEPMVLSTNPEYMGLAKKQAKGISAGETIIRGLAGKHAYAVIGVFRIVDGRRFIRVANPWGETGRVTYNQLSQPVDPPVGTGLPTLHYTISKRGSEELNKRIEQEIWSPPGAVYEVNEGVFDLDLDDVTKRFVALSCLAD